VHEPTGSLLEDIYYADNPLRAGSALRTFGAEYVFFSKRISDMGIRATSDTYPPPSQNFESKYGQVSCLDRIYTNGEATLYSFAV
jgi:hypothetical protein